VAVADGEIFGVNRHWKSRNPLRGKHLSRIRSAAVSAPKGQQDSAQGFNPGLVIPRRRALKVAPENDGQSLRVANSPEQLRSGATREAVLQKCLVRIAPRDREVGDAFRAHLLSYLTQG
jgi:hypothetical protein